MSRDGRPGPHEDAASADSGLFGFDTRPEDAELVLIGVPFEATVSYGRGAAQTPARMVRASHQVDLYDAFAQRSVGEEVAMAPLRTDWLELNRSACRAAARGDRDAVNAACARLQAELELEVKRWLRAGKKVGVLGGDHSVPLAAMRALMGGAAEGDGASADESAGASVGAAEGGGASADESAGASVGAAGGGAAAGVAPSDAVGGGAVTVGAADAAGGGSASSAESTEDALGVLQIDAHHDLRIAYEGYRHSHASIMANLLAGAPAPARLTAVGIRDYSAGERERAAGDDRVHTFYERDIRARLYRGACWHDICAEIAETLPRRVYVSFDIDGLDPALCPHTGTPVPGGLAFSEAVHLLETLLHSGRTLVGFDLCEVVPSPDDDDEWDLNVAARLLHKLAALCLAKTGA